MAHRLRHVPARGLLATLMFAALLAVTGSAMLPEPANSKLLERADVVTVDEDPPSISIGDAAVREGDSGIQNMIFTLRLSAPSKGVVMIDVRTLDGTATLADQDYLPFQFRIVFAPGCTAESLAVAVRGDGNIESDEQFMLRLTQPMNAALADSEAVGTIEHDDLPILSIDDASQLEGDTGTDDLSFTFHLSAPAPDFVSLNVSTLDGTATTADSDYSQVNFVLQIAPGDTTANMAVPIPGDGKLEFDEMFLVRLSQPSGAVLADSEAVGVLVNDDRPVISVGDTTIAEGDAGVPTLAFRVRLTPTPLAPVAFHYETQDGTAEAVGGDYLPVSGDTLFETGQDQIVITVPVLGDALLEGNERFTLRITSVTDATPAECSAIGTLANDERASFERVTVPVPMFSSGTLPPAFGDADGDGLPDLPMYLNDGSTFIEMPGVRAQLGNGNYHGASWCDYDRDGDMDFVIMPYGGAESSYNRIHLFENRPGGFVDVAPTLGMDIMGFGETPAWGDFNADGWPDLFLPFYSHVAPFRSYFYLNLGGGQFKEFADSAGVALREISIYWRPEGVAVADWNGDGTLDLYCANHLFMNDGDAHFTDIRPQTGLPPLFDEGCQFVDYDDDGDLDLYVRTAYGPTLYRNDAQHYADVTASLGIGPVGWEWGDRWADLDSDGDMDLLYFPPSTVARLLLNRGDGAFREDSSFTGTLSGSSLSSFADFDGDGDLDIAVGAYGRQLACNLTSQLPRDRTPFLRVRVEDNDGMLTQYGATVRLRSLDDPRHPVQTRIVDGGSGYLGQDEYTVTFGGVGSGTYDLEVSFPTKPGVPLVVGPAQNPGLAAIRPGTSGANLLVVRPNGQVVAGGVAAAPSASSSATATAAALDRGPAPPAPWSASPNPARGTSPIRFTLPGGGKVTLTLHDLSGRTVRMLSGGENAVPSDLAWDLHDDMGQKVPPGIYFARFMRDREASSTQRIVVLP